MELELAHFRYEPLDIDKKGTLDSAIFRQYLTQSFLPSQLERIVISPFEEAAKASGKEELKFDDLRIKISTPKKRASVKWSEVYDKFNTFLEIRSKEEEAKKSKILKYREGIGWCLSIDDVTRLLSILIKTSTSKVGGSPNVKWPKIKNTELPFRDLVVPKIDYSKLIKQVAMVAYNAKKFNKSLENEVTKLYTNSIEAWVRDQTGYDREKIPPKEQSPIKRVWHIGDFYYIFINLVRQDTPQYEKIIRTIIADLNAIKQGERGKLWDLYRPTEDRLVNLKKLSERLSNLYTDKEHIKSNVRYEIVPK